MLYDGLIKAADRKIDQSEKQGPFDIIGDVHGCYPELLTLLAKLGFEVDKTTSIPTVSGNSDRMLVFLGDLIDRGPDSLAVLELVMDLCKKGQALCIPGNHDEKLMRHLMGHHVIPRGGIETSMAQLEGKDGHLLNRIKDFLLDLPTYLILDSGKLLISHAGLKEEHHGKSGRDIREASLFGEGTDDEHGNKQGILAWIDSYKGKALVVYGHSPVKEPDIRNHTVNIDTGCVYGGILTAYRYPENQLVSVDAEKKYFEREIGN